jgi:hypothetical protein
MLGGLRNFHLKKNVIHQRNDATHGSYPLATIMPAYLPTDSQQAAANGMMRVCTREATES